MTEPWHTDTFPRESAVLHEPPPPSPHPLSNALFVLDSSQEGLEMLSLAWHLSAYRETCLTPGDRKGNNAKDVGSVCRSWCKSAPCEFSWFHILCNIAFLEIFFSSDQGMHGVSPGRKKIVCAHRFILQHSDGFHILLGLCHATSVFWDPTCSVYYMQD